MKKFLSFILLTSMMLTTLVGCSNNKTTEPNKLSESVEDTSSIGNVLDKIEENTSEIKDKIDETISEITSESTETESEKNETQETPEKEPVVLEEKSVLTGTIELIDELNKTSNNDNVVASGLSLNYALAMLLNGTNEEASAELEKFLGMTKEEANTYYSRLLNSYTDNEVLIANSFWFNKDDEFAIKSTYTDVLSSKYKASVEKISMDNKGADIINNWVKEKTKGLIKEILDGKDLTGMDSVLVNTVTFDGKWKIPFKSINTMKNQFTNIDGSTTEVDMMNSNEFFYYENEKAVGFKKEYTNDKYYFVGILPKQEGEFNLSDLDIEGLLNSEKTTNELNIDLMIKFPKIDISKDYQLVDILKDMGVNQVFDSSKNNLSEIFDVNDPAFTSYVNKVAQNVVLKVDEEGTKAAAATSVIIDANGSAMPRDLKTIEFNRPFVCIIMDKENNVPLFVAKITNFK